MRAPLGLKPSLSRLQKGICFVPSKYSPKWALASTCLEKPPRGAYDNPPGLIPCREVHPCDRSAHENIGRWLLANPLAGVKRSALNLDHREAAGGFTTAGLIGQPWTLT